MLFNVKFTQFSDANQVPRMHNHKKCEFYFTWNNFFFTPSDEVRLPFLVVVVVVFITSTHTVNDPACVPAVGRVALSPAQFCLLVPPAEPSPHQSLSIHSNRLALVTIANLTSLSDPGDRCPLVATRPKL